MERYNESQFLAAGWLHALGRGLRHAERPLLRFSILLCTALGLALGLTRFIFVLRENLQAPTANVNATLFLAAMVGGVALLIVLFSAAIGFCIGALLEAGYGWWSTRKKSSSLP